MIDGKKLSRPRFIALLLALVTLVVYLPVTRDRFVNYDDDDYVTANRIVQNGLTWDGVKWAFTTGHASNWHPVTWLSHMTDCELFGVNAGAHHFVNVLIHSVNVALLFALLLRLTSALWPSVLVAALFALASAACGVGGVGFRAEGRFEHVLRAADAAGLCEGRDKWQFAGNRRRTRARIKHHAVTFSWP